MSRQLEHVHITTNNDTSNGYAGCIQKCHFIISDSIPTDETEIIFETANFLSGNRIKHLLKKIKKPTFA